MLKIVFPIAVTTIVILLVPSAVPLFGMLMFGTISIGISVYVTMTMDAFLKLTTIGILIGGFLAFGLSISGDIFFVKIYNLFTKKKINPIICAIGLSAVPMVSRVANEIALNYDPKNHVLQYLLPAKFHV